MNLITTVGSTMITAVQGGMIPALGDMIVTSITMGGTTPVVRSAVLITALVAAASIPIYRMRCTAAMTEMPALSLMAAQAATKASESA
jgi:hypothetical protein